MIWRAGIIMIFSNFFSKFKKSKKDDVINTNNIHEGNVVLISSKASHLYEVVSVLEKHYYTLNSDYLLLDNNDYAVVINCAKDRKEIDVE